MSTSWTRNLTLHTYFISCTSEQKNHTETNKKTLVLTCFLCLILSFLDNESRMGWFSFLLFLFISTKKPKTNEYPCVYIHTSMLWFNSCGNIAFLMERTLWVAAHIKQRVAWLKLPNLKIHSDVQTGIKKQTNRFTVGIASPPPPRDKPGSITCVEEKLAKPTVSLVTWEAWRAEKPAAVSRSLSSPDP